MTSQAAQKSKRFKVWLESAINDLNASEVSLNNQLYEWTCYQAVQSVEKVLKAVIVHAGWNPPKTHKLGVLVSLCNKANNMFTNVKLNFRILESYTFITRYPFVYPDQGNRTPHEIISKKDAETCHRIAKDLHQKVNDFLSKSEAIVTFAPEIQQFYYSEEEIKERIQGVIVAIRNADKINVQKIMIFGSFAREKVAARTKTMDILVVGETELNFIDRLTYVRELTKGSEPIVEPLVYTPNELDFMLNEEGEGFLESAIAEGRVLYEAVK
jgi:HEPN domain-containing protein/predicted nucleotidyltransferase